MLRDVGSALFVLEALDILLRHARNPKLERQFAEPIANHFETALVPALVQLLTGVAAAPAFVCGVLQDNGPDWTTDKLLELKMEDIAKTISADISRAEKINDGRANRFLPAIKSPVATIPFPVNRKAMLLSHIDMRDSRILQRVLFLLLTISADETAFAWLLRQPATLTQITSALGKIAQYTLDSDPFLSRDVTLRNLRASHTLRTVGPIVPILLVMFDNIAAFMSDPDRAAPSEADVRAWTDTIWPAICITLNSIASIVPSSILLQYHAPELLSPTLPKPADLVTLRRELFNAVYPLRRRGGFLWKTDLGTGFAGKADLFQLAFDHLYHAITKLSARVPALLSDNAMRHLYEWSYAQLADGKPRTVRGKELHCFCCCLFVVVCLLLFVVCCLFCCLLFVVVCCLLLFVCCCCHCFVFFVVVVVVCCLLFVVVILCLYVCSFVCCFFDCFVFSLFFFLVSVCVCFLTVPFLFFFSLLTFSAHAHTNYQWTVANGRILVLNSQLETPALLPADVSLSMSEGGGTLLLQHLGNGGSATNTITRIPLMDAPASHANDPDQVWAEFVFLLFAVLLLLFCCWLLSFDVVYVVVGGGGGGGGGRYLIGLCL